MFFHFIIYFFKPLELIYNNLSNYLIYIRYYIKFHNTSYVGNVRKGGTRDSDPITKFISLTAYVLQVKSENFNINHKTISTSHIYSTIAMKTMTVNRLQIFLQVFFILTFVKQVLNQLNEYFQYLVFSRHENLAYLRKVKKIYHN